MTTGGYQAWQTENGEWRFMVMTLPDYGTGKGGEMITGVQTDEEPDDGKGLTEVKFRRVLAQRYGLSLTQIDLAVQTAKSGRPGSPNHG